MSTWDDRWGPIIAERKARQDAGLAERIRRIDERFRPIDGRFRPNYMAILPEPSGSLRQGGGSVAAINVNVDPKIDTVSGGDPPDGAGLPDGYTFEEFTICDSGEPATRWWPTWTSNPEA